MVWGAVMRMIAIVFYFFLFTGFSSNSKTVAPGKSYKCTIHADDSLVDEFDYDGNNYTSKFFGRYQIEILPDHGGDPLGPVGSHQVTIYAHNPRHTLQIASTQATFDHGSLNLNSRLYTSDIDAFVSCALVTKAHLNE